MILTMYLFNIPVLNGKICKILICRLKKGNVLFLLANLDVERLV